MQQNKHPEFPLDDGLIYLNHAAVSPWPKRTSVAVKNFAEQNSQFGSKYYLQWLQKESELRCQLQKLLNAPSQQDIALVKNTSEAISFVAYGLHWKTGDNIVSSNEEFPSNRIAWESLNNLGVEFRQADLGQESTPEDSLFALVDENTRLLTVSSIQFSTGLRLDLELIGEFCKQHNILFCIDAIQSLGAVAFDVQAYHADFVMADGHKWMMGPEGLGVFYAKPEARDQLKLTQFGWHMIKSINSYENKPWEIHPSAQRFECGSPNMLGIHALSASLSLILETSMAIIEERVLHNVQYLQQIIADAEHLQLICKQKETLLSGIICFRHLQSSNLKVFKDLQKHNVICALRGRGIRFSPHFYNTKLELENAINFINSPCI